MFPSPFSFWSKKLTGISLCGALFLCAGCVEFKKMSLYSGEEVVSPAPRPNKIDLVVEPIIFEEDATDVWGLETTVCKEAGLSYDIASSGTTSILLTWDRNVKGCEWAGIGIGWDSYAGKDISEIIDYAAIEMQVRSHEGKMFGLPIVLTLEDYSGGMGFAYTGNKYFERPFIDEEWQKVVVPLNTFDMQIENLDPTNIKQIMFELQQSGSIYLDDIKLVFYQEEPQQPWLVEAPLPDPLAMPQVLFDDAFINNNGWGLMTDDCRTFTISTTEHTQGTRSIHTQWDAAPDDCKNITIGVSWHKWYPVDLTSIVATTQLTFQVKTAGGTFSELPVAVVLEDYGQVQAAPALLRSSYVTGGKYDTEWKTVTIPLAALSEGIDRTNVKQLLFRFKESGDIFIDDIRLQNSQR